MKKKIVSLMLCFIVIFSTALTTFASTLEDECCSDCAIEQVLFTYVDCCSDCVVGIRLNIAEEDFYINELMLELFNNDLISRLPDSVLGFNSYEPYVVFTYLPDLYYQLEAAISLIEEITEMDGFWQGYTITTDSEPVYHEMIESRNACNSPKRIGSSLIGSNWERGGPVYFNGVRIGHLHRCIGHVVSYVSQCQVCGTQTWHVTYAGCGRIVTM